MFLLIKSIDEIKKKYKIEKVFLSGWHSYEKQYSYNNYFLSFMVKSLFKNLKVKQFFNNKLVMKKSLAYNYKLKNYELLKNGKYVLLNNLGYNFNRLLLYLYFNRYKTVVPIIESDTQISNYINFFINYWVFVFYIWRKIKYKKK